MQVQFSAQRGLVFRWSIIAVVMVSAALLVPLTALGLRPALLISVLPIGLLGFMVMSRWPDLGFPLLVVASLLVPFSISTGTQTGINVSIILVCVLVGLWVLDLVTRREEFIIHHPAVMWPIAGLIVTSILAFGFGQFIWLPIRPTSLAAQVGGLSIFLLSPGIFLLAAHRFRSMKVLEWTTWLFFGLGGIYVLSQFAPALRQQSLRLFQRAVLDSMFWTWISTIAFSQAILNRYLKPIWRVVIALVGLCAFNFIIVVRQSWISGWIPALISIMTIIFLLRPKWVVVGGIIFGLTLVLQPQLIDQIFLTGDNQYSLTTRLEAWRVLLDIIKLNPILGLGPANYYQYTPLFNILGYSVNFNSHNNYVDILAQIGMIGLGCFIWFTWALGRSIKRNLDRVPEGFARAFMYGAMGGLIGTIAAGMLGDWVLPFVYNVGLEGFRASSLAWMFLGFAIALVNMDRHHDGAGPERIQSKRFEHSCP